MSESQENQPKRNTIKRIKFMWNAVSSGNYDKDIVPREYHEYVRFERDKTARLLSDVMIQHLPLRNSQGEPIRVLDIAAGTGIISSALSEKGYQVTALDLSHKALFFLQQHNPEIQTIVADLNQHFPFAEESFDGVTTVMGNRYINNIDLFLQNVYKVLKPGGIFIWPIYPHEAIYWRLKSGLRQHTSPSSLAKDSEKAGFKEVAIIKSNLYSIYSFKKALNSNPVFIVASK